MLDEAQARTGGIGRVLKQRVLWNALDLAGLLGMFSVSMTYFPAHTMVMHQCKRNAAKRAQICTPLHMQAEQPCPAGECVVWGS